MLGIRWKLQSLFGSSPFLVIGLHEKTRVAVSVKFFARKWAYFVMPVSFDNELPSILYLQIEVYYVLCAFRQRNIEN